MKKVFTVVFTILLAAGLTFAQTGGGSDSTAKTPATTTGKKPTKTSKAHKGGKKSKKGSTSTSTTTNPK